MQKTQTLIIQLLFLKIVDLACQNDLFLAFRHAFCILIYAATFEIDDIIFQQQSKPLAIAV